MSVQVVVASLTVGAVAAAVALTRGRTLAALCRTISPVASILPVRPLIILFGDSITQQSYMPGGWGARLSDYYQRTADVQLRGYSGYNTRWALRLIPDVFPISDAVPAVTPALVTIMLGANDANLPAPLRGHSAAASNQHVPLDEYVSNLRQLVGAAKRAGNGGSRVLLITPPPCDGDAWGAHCARTYPGYPADAEPNRNFEGTKAYANACVKLGEQLNVPTLDLHNAFVARSDWRSLLVDGLHPNAQGGEAIATLVLEAIGKHFPELRPSSFFDDDPAKLPLDFPDFKAIDSNRWSQSFVEHAERKSRRLTGRGA